MLTHMHSVLFYVLHGIMLTLGCYPRCPPERPYLEESTMKCVQKEQCGCYVDGKHYEEGEDIPSVQNCHTWYLWGCNAVEDSINYTYSEITV